MITAPSQQGWQALNDNTFSYTFLRLPK